VAVLGAAWQGLAGHGWARQGKDFKYGWAGQGPAGRGTAGLGKAWQGMDNF